MQETPENIATMKQRTLAKDTMNQGLDWYI